MALTDFFRINMPYGMEKTDNGWFVFNREYLQLGSVSIKQASKTTVKYKNLTDNKLNKLIEEDAIRRQMMAQ